MIYLYLTYIPWMSFSHLLIDSWRGLNTPLQQQGNDDRWYTSHWTLWKTGRWKDHGEIWGKDDERIKHVGSNQQNQQKVWTTQTSYRFSADINGIVQKKQGGWTNRNAIFKPKRTWFLQRLMFDIQPWNRPWHADERAWLSNAATRKDNHSPRLNWKTLKYIRSR